MVRQLLTLFFLLLLPLAGFSQITASDSSGCAPLVGVNFTGVPGASGIQWNFDDGSSSTLPNPNHTFTQPGTYTVTYNATVGGSPVSQSIIITVFPKPVPQFTSSPPVTGCVPLPVTFTSTSTGGGGSSITSHSWTFGDGGVLGGNNANPTYNYTVGGQYSITLIVTDQNGCDSSLTLPNHVNVSAKPVPVIVTSPNPPVSCTPPLTVTFNGSSSVSNATTGSALAYSWDFANGNTSTSPTPPAQTYTLPGVYPVKLKVTDVNYCSDSVITNVIIANPFASFVVADTVCMDAVFNPAASSLGTYTWDYGDGTTGTDPFHTYATPGLYNVKLTVTNGNCQDDSIRQVYVEDVVAAFSISPTYSCATPQIINITNNSVNGSIYQWTFDSLFQQYAVSPMNSNAFQPVLTITNADTNQYTINEFDTLLGIQLIVISSHGCRDTLEIKFMDSLYLPTARLQPDVSQGCVPLNVTFSDSSRSNEPIVSRVWDFGDGTIINSNVGAISHTYTSPGIYYATVTIINSAGCIDTSYKMEIRVANPPIPAFSVSPTTICHGDSITFTDLSVPGAGSQIDSWHYYTDNGFLFSGSCWNDPNPSGAINGSTGPQSVTLEVCSHGCCASQTINNAYTVNGPLVEFSSSSHCDTPLVYSFQGNIQDATSWTWDFGDGTIITTSTQQNITHTYAVPGEYLVMLTGVNNVSGCQPDTFKRVIHAAVIHADFAINDTIFCNKTPQFFDASASTGVGAQGNNGYIWIWGDGTAPTITSNPVSGHAYDSAGVYPITLITRDFNGCQDTIRKSVKVSSVSAAFSVDKYYLCRPDSVTFTDLSVSDTSLVAWQWFFDDGGTSGLQNPVHHYTTSANDSFIVRFIAINELGCRDTIMDTLVYSLPMANFFLGSSANICAGDSVNFLPFVYNHLNYNWQFGDGDSAAFTSGWHTYSGAGSFPASLTVSDTIGCKRTYNYPVTVKVQDYPQAGFFSDLDSITPLCYPVSIQFTDTSIANIFQSRQWDLGTGSVVPNVTVGTSFTQPGLYPVELIITTTFGCRDTVTKTFEVTGPEADFIFSPGTICKGQTVGFEITDTSRVFTYHWDFGDGTDTTALSPISHQFNDHPANGQANVTLIYWSSDSTCVKTLTQAVNIHQVVADFNRNNDTLAVDTAHCLGVTDIFTNYSQNATTWSWDFGDGTSGNQFNPQHLYQSAGTFDVTLAISNSTTGCLDTLKKTMIIHPLPVVSAIGGDTCMGSPVQLSASGGVGYEWSPTTGLDNPNISNPVATPGQTTTYTVSVTDTNDCQGSAIAVVNIIQPPPAIIWDTAIVIGQSVVLPYYISPVNGYTFSWNPADSLSCTDCPNPTANPTVNTTYELIVKDNEGCFESRSYFTIEILPVSSVDVPTAFTPNGDGINDIVYVNGWGIKRLLEFNIYNRWGELVFSSNDISVGWDGTYKGVPQNLETYAYTVKVETYVDPQPLELKGFIKLIR